MNINNIGIIALLASAAAFWSQLRAAVSKFLSFFIRTDTIYYAPIAKHLIAELLKNSKIIRWGNSNYLSERQTYLSSHKYWIDTLSRAEYALFLIYKNKTPIFVKMDNLGLSITYVYKTFPMKEMLDDSYERYKTEIFSSRSKDRNNQFYITEINGEDTSLLKAAIANESSKPSSNTFSNNSPSLSSNQFIPVLWLNQYAQYVGMDYKDLTFNTNEERPNYYWTAPAILLKEKMIFWRDSMEWFIERGIQYRFSALLYGKPGCGKTKMVLAAAQDAGIPLKRINISNMSDSEFLSQYNTSGNNAMIILIEDIDCVFSLDRKNKLAKDNRTKSLLSFDTIINAISGIKDRNGIFLVITTNHKESCDEALIRPGRCDIHIEVGNLEEEGRRFIAKNILRDWPELSEEMVAKYPEITVADFEKKCIDLAIEKFYKEKGIK